MPLLSVYNNLIHGYVMRRQTRFDSHDRSELRAIHSRLRQMNREQPLYKIEFDDDIQEYAIMVKEHAMDVTASMKELSTDDSGSVFRRTAVESDDPKKVSVEVLDGSDISHFDGMDVSVLTISSPEIHEGRVISAEESPLAAGQYSFTVEIEGDYYSFQFNVTGKNTNEELQLKLADFINKTSVGIKAKVITDKNNGATGLDLESRKNGVSFKFTDTKKPDGVKKGVVDFFELNNIKHEPSITKAVVDGVEIETESRDYTTAEGLHLHFKRVTTDKDVRISTVYDEEQVYDKVSEFVDTYNSFFRDIRNGAERRHATKRLMLELNAFVAKYEDVLAGNGIRLDESGNGDLSIDREELYKATQSGSLAKMFSKDSDVVRGFVNKLSDISLNPMGYVDKTIVVYPNIRSQRAYNPYITSIYSGMMYNNYC